MAVYNRCNVFFSRSRKVRFFTNRYGKTAREIRHFGAQTRGTLVINETLVEKRADGNTPNRPGRAVHLGRLSIDAVLGRTAGLKNGTRKPHTIL